MKSVIFLLFFFVSATTAGKSNTVWLDLSDLELMGRPYIRLLKELVGNSFHNVTIDLNLFVNKKGVIDTENETKILPKDVKNFSLLYKNIAEVLKKINQAFRTFEHKQQISSGDIAISRGTLKQTRTILSELHVDTNLIASVLHNMSIDLSKIPLVKPNKNGFIGISTEVLQSIRNDLFKYTELSKKLTQKFSSFYNIIMNLNTTGISKLKVEYLKAYAKLNHIMGLASYDLSVETSELVALLKTSKNNSNVQYNILKFFKNVNITLGNIKTISISVLQSLMNLQHLLNKIYKENQSSSSSSGSLF